MRTCAKLSHIAFAIVMCSTFSRCEPKKRPPVADVETPTERAAPVNWPGFPSMDALPVLQPPAVDLSAINALNDTELANEIISGSGTKWARCMETANTRRSEALLRAMASCLDKSEGIWRFSEDAVYYPDLNFPAVQFLRQVGPLAVQPLLEKCFNTDVPLKRRVLAALLLIRVSNHGERRPGMTATLPSIPPETNKALLEEAMAIAMDSKRLEKIYPVEYPELGSTPRLPTPTRKR